VLLLTEQDVRRLLDVPALLTALERAFVELSAGRASVPPRVAARTSNGLLGAMPGYLPGVALEAKLVTVFPSNHEHDRPGHQGVIVLFDERDGTPLALMDGVRITAIRTAAAAALSVQLLAREDAAVLAILGAGVQGGIVVDRQGRVEGLISIADISEQLTTGPAPSPSPAPEPAGATS